MDRRRFLAGAGRLASAAALLPLAAKAMPALLTGEREAQPGIQGAVVELQPVVSGAEAGGSESMEEVMHATAAGWQALAEDLEARLAQVLQTHIPAGFDAVRRDVNFSELKTVQDLFTAQGIPLP